VEFAQHALIEKLVPVLDDFERAIASLEDYDSPAARGLTLIWEKFSKTLADAGLDRIETTGKTFDPTLHEALTTQPVEPDRAEQVLEELVPGYTFRNRLVRPARVCVGVEAPRTGDDSPRR
jgi:molecular chaperone GrpE